MVITGSKDSYEIVKQVADAEAYRLFLCEQHSDSSECLLQIAKKVADNGHLDRVAFLLSELKNAATEIDQDYAEKMQGEKHDSLNYDLGFPNLVESFSYLKKSQKHKVNILTFRCVELIKQMVPLGNITDKDGLRVDLRTSAWFLGKILKILGLVHALKISVNLMNDQNILIEPEHHYVLIFDWMSATIHPNQIPVNNRRQDIAGLARAVISVLGGDWRQSYIPDDKEEPFTLYAANRFKLNQKRKKLDYRNEAFNKYTDFLFRLAQGHESDANRAHDNFYCLIDQLWKREFYPFTTKPLGGNR